MRLRVALTLAALLVTGCGVEAAAPDRLTGPETVDSADSGTTAVSLGEPTTPPSTAPAIVPFGPLPDMAAVSADGKVAIIRGGSIGDAATGLVAADEATLVSTATTGDVTTVTWTAMRSGVDAGSVVVTGDLTAAATDLTGQFVALTTSTFAGGTEVVIASAAQGEVFRQSYASELLPEGFSNFTLEGSPVPGGVFVVEFLEPKTDDAEAPRRYRVRVLDTSTGELQLPLNLRDKGQLVDEQMLGFSRTHVASRANGLLFTLYRGLDTDESQYAFVHTLGFVNGVWCLDLPAELWLERLPGAVVLTDDEAKLLVASANGYVTEFVISDITDPQREPLPARTEHAWSSAPGGPAPALAWADGTLLAAQDATLRWLDSDSLTEHAEQSWDMSIESVALLPNGDAVAAGSGRISQITPDGQLAAESPLPANFGPVSSLVVFGG